MNRAYGIFLFLLLGFPLVSEASVKITEIMYDLEGTDSGLEWIEVYNGSSEAIDISQWYFREQGVNHGLTPQSSSLFAPNTYLLIVQNVSNFSDDLYVVKSSFSLSNTGETLAILDETQTEVDSVSYSSESGATGDGRSLQLLNGVWKSGPPTPGADSSHAPPDPSESDDEEDEEESEEETNDEYTSDDIDDTDPREEPEFRPYYEPYIQFPSVIVAGSPARFEAGVYKITEERRTREIDGMYRINFGEGTLYESEERIDTEHIYYAPGTYIVFFEYFSSSLKQEVGDHPQAQYRKIITVTDHDITLNGTDGKGGVTVTNNTDKDIDVSGWSLHLESNSYTFPGLSYLRSKESLTIPHEVLGFVPTNESLLYGYLLNSEGRYIDMHLPEKEESNEKTTLVSSNYVLDSVVNNIDDIEIGENVLLLEEGQEFQELQSRSQYEYQSDNTEPRKSSGSRTSLFVASAITVLTGVARIYIQRKRMQQRQHEESEEE